MKTNPSFARWIPLGLSEFSLSFFFFFLCLIPNFFILLDLNFCLNHLYGFLHFCLKCASNLKLHPLQHVVMKSDFWDKYFSRFRTINAKLIRCQIHCPRELAKDFVVSGTASESLYGACEAMFKPDMVCWSNPFAYALYLSLGF